MELQRMPALFAGLEELSVPGWDAAALQQATQAYPRPRAIVCVSPRWQTRGVCISIAPEQDSLHAMESVSTRVARRVAGLLDMPSARLDSSHPLDPEVVQLVQALYPQADIPVVQISLDSELSALEHAALAAWLRPLREQGVLIAGIGTICPDADDATRQQVSCFRDQVGQLIDEGDIVRLAECRLPAPGGERHMHLAPSALPLLYALAVREAGDSVEFFNGKCAGMPATPSVVLHPKAA
ncbi:MAG: hypothetical protein ACN6RG_01820 [Stenotrophomonas sp.]|jgi:4,5-DOPA dioxygenase extradiol|uniref:hypothetical protein n=1 Tax=unclassified Stenotrophomonas TaxID=196198 RepID=UPI001785A7DC|nr:MULTISPECIES: hypothetical protein [unclassified Stenotrophomonas]MBD9535724.1 hypothetical protein [Stenotrophomonas sp. STM01]